MRLSMSTRAGRCSTDTICVEIHLDSVLNRAISDITRRNFLVGNLVLESREDCASLHRKSTKKIKVHIEKIPIDIVTAGRKRQREHDNNHGESSRQRVELDDHKCRGNRSLSQINEELYRPDNCNV